jgi:hypothetical protein
MRPPQATLVDPLQAARVRLAIRLKVDPENIGDWRARIELPRLPVAPSGEEVIAWQR